MTPPTLSGVEGIRTVTRRARKRPVMIMLVKVHCRQRLWSDLCFVSSPSRQSLHVVDVVDFYFDKFVEKWRPRPRAIGAVAEIAACRRRPAPSICYNVTSPVHISNNVESKQHCQMVQVERSILSTKSNVASTKSNVASTLLLVWTGLNCNNFMQRDKHPLKQGCQVACQLTLQ